MGQQSRSGVRFGRVARVNAPRSLRRDLYVRLIGGSWWRLLGLLVGLYVCGNASFAGLFLLGGDCIEGARPGSFFDAFHFSVQTMATIGYGVMSPKTPWAHTVVAVEALCGLLGLSVATSLSFAKLARPTANIEFSRVAVVGRRDGTPTLMFRAANGRGNDVLEASVRVSLLRTERTAEGETMRRMHQLQLIRDSSPIFLLSWTIMHVIDQSSPLWGVDAEAFAADEMMLIVTMTGLDGTYAQTVHARTAFHHDELRWGHQLVDVMTTREDGTVVLDYEHFDATRPEDPVA
ncbi:MAG: ATP-sensitive inward rectifier potassium channel 10 [Deltaproteobacteria bacterium]|nr:ATP-sensitive inward rectifier potassium channel 10 [Deltaproteobacteria bacterium]